VTGERYQMALRMGGAKSGKEVGERLLDAGISEDEAVKCILHFLEHCKVGKVTASKTIRVEENCESIPANNGGWKIHIIFREEENYVERRMGSAR
jgi:hypothetical protein